MSCWEGGKGGRRKEEGRGPGKIGRGDIFHGYGVKTHGMLVSGADSVYPPVTIDWIW